MTSRCSEYIHLLQNKFAPFDCLFCKQKAELKLTCAYEPKRFVFRSWQECSVHACQWHHRTALLTGECHPLWLAWHPEDAAKTESRMANPVPWGKYCLSSASQISQLKPSMSGETDRSHCQIPPSSLMWPTTRCSDFISNRLSHLYKSGQWKGENNFTTWQGQWCILYLETDLESPQLTRASGCHLQEAESMPTLIIAVSLHTFRHHLSQMTHIHLYSKA